MNEQHCDQCENQCAVDSLRCNKGRIRFGLEPVESKLPAGPVGLLQRCGHILHHSGMDPEGAM